MNDKVSPNKPTLNLIPRTLRSALPDLKKHYGVENLGAFGSFVTGENKRNSDLDVLVEFCKSLTMFEFVRLERHLTTLVGVKVDLVMKTALEPEIGTRILAEVVKV